MLSIDGWYYVGAGVVIKSWWGFIGCCLWHRSYSYVVVGIEAATSGAALTAGLGGRSVARGRAAAPMML